MDHRIEIRQFVQQLLRQKRDERPFSDSDSLVLSGRFESVDAVEIVIFLEQTWGIDFARIGFDATKIDSVDSINQLLNDAELAT